MLKSLISCYIEIKRNKRERANYSYLFIHRIICGHLQPGDRDFLILISNFYYFKIGKEKENWLLKFSIMFRLLKLHCQDSKRHRKAEQSVCTDCTDSPLSSQQSCDCPQSGLLNMSESIVNVTPCSGEVDLAS